MEPIHRRLENEIRRLARYDLPAAEVRRRLRPLAAELSVAPPGYTAVLELVRDERLASRPGLVGHGVALALVVGRVRMEGRRRRVRALVHKLWLLGHQSRRRYPAGVLTISRRA